MMIMTVTGANPDACADTGIDKPDSSGDNDGDDSDTDRD